MFRTLRALLRVRNNSHAAMAGRAGSVGISLTVALLTLLTPAVAYADPGAVTVAANSLPQVVANLRTWIMNIFIAVATLFLVLSGVYRATAGGDLGQIEKAKEMFKNALIGYALAVLAPVLLEVVRGIVGG